MEVKNSFLKILTGSDSSSRNLPLMMIKSQNPGPMVWLAGCVHGDEIGGTVAIQEVFKMAKKNLLKGSLFAFPLMNPLGFEAGSRHIVLTKEDLNRSFPGNKNGSLAQRIADKIFTTIMKTHPTLVLDLHNDWRKSIPYLLIDPDPGSKYKNAYKKTKEFSQKTGLPMVLETEDTNNTLSYSCLKGNIPALSLELGESDVVNEKNIECGKKSIWNILTYLGMVNPVRKQGLSKRAKILKYSDKPLSSKSGIIRFLVGPGDFVKKNQAIAKIYNAFGGIEETLLCLQDSIVLGCSDSAVAFPGAAIMAFGVV